MRFGLGWRRELGAGILAHLDRIDVVELLAEEYFEATERERQALRFLRSCVPVVIHATSLGLASPEPVDGKRLDALARLLEWLEPESWSEHLAFVRFGGREIGHLAAPPRNRVTLEGLVRNVERARRVTGSLPLLENVATLLDPPDSELAEGEWLDAVVDATGAGLLLDLHNLHANATNFNFDAAEAIRSLPQERIAAVHLAGGHWSGDGTLIDDHRNPLPAEVYALLREIRAGGASVILERDGNYPPIGELLDELDLARATVLEVEADGFVAARRERSAASGGHRSADSAAVHQFLAALYCDAETLERFLQQPEEEAEAHGLPPTERAAFATIDRHQLQRAARAFEQKRSATSLKGQ